MSFFRSVRRVVGAAKRAALHEFGAGGNEPPAAEARPAFAFESDRYAQTFLVRQRPTSPPEGRLPRRVFTLWTGDNDLSPNRKKSLDALRNGLRVPLVLVTPDTLSEWVVPEHPLHPAYENLSLVHRSDYLRAYLLHHHGGGYTDLKVPTGPWTEAFDAADRDDSAWLIGCAERNAGDVAQVGGATGRDLAANYASLATCCSMISRAKSPFTTEWLREVERRLDYFAPHLEEEPGDILGSKPEYPVKWTALMGDVYHPLQLKYLDHVMLHQALYLDYENYR